MTGTRHALALLFVLVGMVVTAPQAQADPDPTPLPTVTGTTSDLVVNDDGLITAFTVTDANGNKVVITVNTNPEITARIESANVNNKTVTVTYKTNPQGQNTFVQMVVH